jgi:putative phosphoribosyl transferase
MRYQSGMALGEINVGTGEVSLAADLEVPLQAQGLVLFAHGSGSSRLSRRNQYVAGVLRESHIATVLMDLLTPEEEVEDLHSGHLRFDIELLAERLAGATEWVLNNPQTRDLPIGYFGASTGGGAALVAAAAEGSAVRAVVSRGGRPDMAGAALGRVNAPTLLIVGGDDLPVLELNKRAYAEIKAEKRLEVIPGATHLFEEPGALEQVAHLAAMWFARYLPRE